MDPAPRLKAEQCTATSKATRQRCRRLVIGGGVCVMHGGRARQVAAAREARIVALQAAASSTPVMVRDPATALLSAAQDADEVVQRIKLTITESGHVDAASLDAFGTWLDRVNRLAKSVLDSGVHKHQVTLAEEQGLMLAQVIRNTVDALLVEAVVLLGDSPEAEAMRRAWPRWVSEIVPREIAAVRND